MIPVLSSRRNISILALFAIIVIVLLAHTHGVNETWRELPQRVGHSVGQSVGLGEWIEPGGRTGSSWIESGNGRSNKSDIDGANGGVNIGYDEVSTPRPEFVPGIAKPPGEEYRKALIVPRTKREKVEWITKELGDTYETYIYVANDLSAPLHPPANKGHEVMVYLTYLIDHYDDLPDVMVFMHAHQRAWHNNDVLGNDAAQMLRRLSPARVTREGYFNMRCQWYPGCPDWMHPGETKMDVQKTEQVLIAKAWAEIFPLDPVPDVLAQPCCSQFALSRERVLAIPRAQFVYYRDWLLHTQLKDFVSGRVWEYMWQFAFTGRNQHCPVEHACYCDGYGVCFGGKAQRDAWFAIRSERDKYNKELLLWDGLTKKIDRAKANHANEADLAKLAKPEPGKDIALKQKIVALQKEMDRRRDEALERGTDPKNRAIEAGREWNEGDGF